MKNKLLMMAMILLFSACAKEEFAVNKGSQNTSLSALDTTANKLCAQSTLISPKVDILLLWDNSSSFSLVNSSTKASMNTLISSIPERFDYHILSVPLVSQNANTLYEAQLVAKNPIGLNTTAMGILKDKATAAQSLNFSTSNQSAEPGINRATQVIEANRSNGIFRNEAYTIIVMISNEDDDTCELETGYGECGSSTWKARVDAQINKLLCMRGNSYANCSATGYSSSNSLNSLMMRFINISQIKSSTKGLCTNGVGGLNQRYKYVADTIYKADYTNGMNRANDHLNPMDSLSFDSYDLCTVGFNHIFDGLQTSITESILKHKYDYWPVTGATTSIDPSTIRVVRSDGKILANRTGESNPTDGYTFENVYKEQNTRFYPTAGEMFKGKLIQLHGVDGNDKIVYPDCLTVTFNAEKTTYGYVYLQYGEPNTATIEVRINGSLVPQSATNGWDYMGLQYTAALDQGYKVANMPSGTTSGYFIRLNGNYKIQNTSSNTVSVLYNSKNSN